MVPQVSNNRGFAALIGVLVLGVVASATASALVYSGMRSLEASLDLRQSYEAKGIARACADTALRVVHDNNAYMGTGSVTLGAGSCTYTVTDSGGSVRNISVTATVANVTRRISVVTSALSPRIVISSWRDA